MRRLWIDLSENLLFIPWMYMEIHIFTKMIKRMEEVKPK